MAQPMQHTAAEGTRMGLKARIAGLLKERSASKDPAIAKAGMTIGEIGAALSLPKTDHGALASALIKLRNQSFVNVTTGPATSTTGPKFVKRYAWKAKADAPTHLNYGPERTAGPIRAQIRVGDMVMDIGSFKTQAEADAAKVRAKHAMRKEMGLPVEEAPPSAIDDRRFLSLIR